jgi:hypothetical protein
VSSEAVTGVLWLVILAAALTLEGLGLFRVGGLWPLTWVIRAGLHKNQALTSLGILLACVGFPAWLIFHFLFSKPPKNEPK